MGRKLLLYLCYTNIVFPPPVQIVGKYFFTHETNLLTTEDDINTIRLSTFPIPFKILHKTIFIELEENTANPILYKAKFERVQIN